MPNESTELLFQHAREAMCLQTIADTLEWDERTGMPIEGGDYRVDQVSMLRGLVHRKRTEPRYGELLQQAQDDTANVDPSSDIAASVRGLQRQWNRDSRLPESLVTRISRATVVGQQRWDAARKADDFSVFDETLSEIISLKQEEGQRVAEGSSRSAYEALLDEYEPDARADQLSKVFTDLRMDLVELIGEVRSATRQPDRSIMERSYDVDAQRAFSRYVAEKIGFDFRRGRLDETSHPFCTTLGPNDCRILTRYDKHWLPGGLLGTMHEAGHGMYEQGLRQDWFGLPSGSYCSLGIHESQSRLWENQVGRSRPFWEWLYPQAKSTFPEALKGVSVDTFHFALNHIQPTLIRVEADEATYNLHIIIRFDLEQELIDGTLSVADLPEAWNARYESDLGVTPPSPANGVLQDVHWSAGLIGYFPTYTLGNLASAQLFASAEKDIGSLNEQFSRGEFEELLRWLRKKVHAKGQIGSGEKLIEDATGEPLHASPLVGYLREKLRHLYGLS